MAYATILARVVTVLAGVAGIGQVYDHEPVATEPGDWETILGSGGIINAWTIDAEHPTELLTNVEDLDSHDFILRGYYQVTLGDVNTSKDAFDTIIQAIKTAWRAEVTSRLNGTCNDMVGAIQFGKPDFQSVGVFLCHFVEATVHVQEIVVRA